MPTFDVWQISIWKTSVSHFALSNAIYSWVFCESIFLWDFLNIRRYFPHTHLVGHVQGLTWQPLPVNSATYMLNFLSQQWTSYANLAKIKVLIRLFGLESAQSSLERMLFRFLSRVTPPLKTGRRWVRREGKFRTPHFWQQSYALVTVFGWLTMGSTGYASMANRLISRISFYGICFFYNNRP